MLSSCLDCLTTTPYRCSLYSFKRRCCDALNLVAGIGACLPDMPRHMHTQTATGPLGGHIRTTGDVAVPMPAISVIAPLVRIER